MESIYCFKYQSLFSFNLFKPIPRIINWHISFIVMEPIWQKNTEDHRGVGGMEPLEVT